MSLHKNNVITHEIYGRNNTKSIDTDFKKDGYERVETFHRDVYGRDVRIDHDIVGDTKAINGYRLKEFDIYNRNTWEYKYDQNGVLTLKLQKGFNPYSFKEKQVDYNTSQDKPKTESTYKYDAYGQLIKESHKDLNDGRTWSHDYEKDAFGRILSRTDTHTNGVKSTSEWFYDDYGRRIMTLIDKDGGKKREVDPGESNNRFTFVEDTHLIDVLTEYSGDTALKVKKLIYNDYNQALFTFRKEANGEYNEIVYDGYYNPIASKDNYTNANWQALFTEYGGHIATLRLTDKRASTEITLDNDVIALLSKEVADKTLTIQGEATDKVFIKEMNEFAKQSGTVSKDGQVYDKYTTQVDSQDYTVLIDTDITVMGV